MAEIEIEVDRERLHQVFINLIKNAADAGASHVTVVRAGGPMGRRIRDNALLIGDPAMIAESEAVVRITV
jgi:signal transduction histidine kinase